MSGSHEPECSSLPPALIAEAAAWSARMDSDNVSIEDQRAFQGWLADDPRRRAAFDSISRMTMDAALLAALGESAGADGRRETPVEQRRTHSGRTRALVSMGLLSIVAWLAWPWFDLALTPQTFVVVPPGQTRTMVLADGSRLELSGGTSLAARIGSSRRTVHLEHGEAFFTVAPDAERPFVVETADGRVQVRGTAFDLSQTRDGLELAVYHGRVAFSRNSLFTDAIDLVAGEKADLNDGVVSAVRHFDVDAGDWRSGWLQTDGITLGGLAERLARRHDLTVQVDAALVGKRIAGRFRLNDPEALLRSLSVIHGFAVIRSGTALLVTAAPAAT